MGLRRYIATSPATPARAARWLRSSVRELSVPAPKAVMTPVLYGYLAARNALYFGRRVFIAEPLFKAYCKEYGEHLHTDVFVHWVIGKGDIILGDHVTFDGKSSISFAHRFAERPTLRVGNHSGFGHNCNLAIGKSITIGNHVRVASGVQMFDSPGHPADPDLRKQGAPPLESEVKPIVIHDNVWIGRGAIIFPGVTIGEGAIVATGAIVMTDVPAYTTAAGNPARAVLANKTQPTKAVR